MVKDSVDKNQDRADVIFREADKAWVPNDPMNRDWQEYQSWVRLGNVPIASVDVLDV
jgi:hypothetical protein